MFRVPCIPPDRDGLPAMPVCEDLFVFHRTVRRMAMLILFVIAGESFALAADPRFVGLRRNGDVITGPEITDWHDAKVEPKLDGKPLFDRANSIRWIRDTTLPVEEEPTAYVEFYGGDRLAGRVIGGNSRQQTLWRHPTHVLFSPASRLDWPDSSRPDGIRLQARWLKRIVWRRRDDARYVPGTAFLKDGGQVSFRSVRWLDSGVRLLVDSDSREFAFSDLSELHLPRMNSWQSWWEQLAVLAPAGLPGLAANPSAPAAPSDDGRPPLMQLESTDGSRLTVSSSRSLPLSRGGGNPEHWHIAVQPAWSLDPLFVPHRSIHTRRWFLANEVPLSVVEPVRVLQSSSLASLGQPRLDRTVTRHWPRGKDRSWGWGLGVHAHSEVEYELPGIPGSFRTACGLDRSTGTGGCIRPRIQLGSGPAASTVIAQGPILTGSEAVFEPAAIPLDGPAEARLTLVVDAVLDDRPTGADPLEVRDIANWIEPLWTFDVDAVAEAVSRQVFKAVAAWEGWTLEGPSPNAAGLVNLSDSTDGRTLRFWTDVTAPGGVFRLSRTLAVGPQQHYLLINCNRFEKGSDPSLLQVLIDGKAVAEFDVPIRYAWQEAPPMLVSLEAYSGKSITVDILQYSDGPLAGVEWRSIQLVERDPQLVCVFDEEPSVAEALTVGDGLISITGTDVASGASALRLTPGERESATFLQPAADAPGIPIRGTPRLGEFRFLRFAWKKIGGQSIAIHLARDGQFPLPETSEPRLGLRYQIGKLGVRPYANGLKLKDQPPAEWEYVTRDLFADFGEFNASGLRLTCADGEAALFDHIYFARRQEDFDAVDPKRAVRRDPLETASDEVKRDLLRWTYEPDRFTSLLAEFAPKWSTHTVGEGLRLWKTYKGRERVLQTHPPDPKTPCILRSAQMIPAGKPVRLRLSVTQYNEQSDWQLKVRVAGEVIEDRLINATLTNNGWADIDVDLSKFAGRFVPIEVHHHPNNWQQETGYWSRIVIE